MACALRLPGSRKGFLSLRVVRPYKSGEHTFVQGGGYIHQIHGSRDIPVRPRAVDSNVFITPISLTTCTIPTYYLFCREIASRENFQSRPVPILGEAEAQLGPIRRLEESIVLLNSEAVSDPTQGNQLAIETSSALSRNDPSKIITS